MGAIQGFNPDRNGDGIISQKEFKAMKKMGLDVNYLDKDGDGKVDKGVKAFKNCVMVGDEERIYQKANLGNGNASIMSTSIITAENGDKYATPVDDVEVSQKTLDTKW